MHAIGRDSECCRASEPSGDGAAAVVWQWFIAVSARTQSYASDLGVQMAELSDAQSCRVRPIVTNLGSVSLAPGGVSRQ